MPQQPEGHVRRTFRWRRPTSSSTEYITQQWLGQISRDAQMTRRDRPSRDISAARRPGKNPGSSVASPPPTPSGAPYSVAYCDRAR